MEAQLSVLPEIDMSGFEAFDMGLEVNRLDGCEFWQPGEVMQYRGWVNGVQVWIERRAGRVSCNGSPMFVLGFGDCPVRTPQVNLQKAVEMIRKELGGSNALSR